MFVREHTEGGGEREVCFFPGLSPVRISLPDFPELRDPPSPKGGN